MSCPECGGKREVSYPTADGLKFRPCSTCRPGPCRVVEYDGAFKDRLRTRCQWCQRVTGITRDVKLEIVQEEREKEKPEP